MSDDVLEMEDARTEYGLPKIWVKLAHVYTADTRLFSSARARLESLETRLCYRVAACGVGGGAIHTVGGRGCMSVHLVLGEELMGYERCSMEVSGTTNSSM